MRATGQKNRGAFSARRGSHSVTNASSRGKTPTKLPSIGST